MTKIFVTKNTSEKTIGGFKLKPGHLFGSIAYDENHNLPFIITEPDSGYLYVCILPDDDEQEFWWWKFPATIDINVIAEGTPARDWLHSAMWEYEYFYESTHGHKPAKIFLDEDSLSCPFLGTALEDTKESDLSLYLIDADVFNEEPWSFHGFNVKPEYIIGFVRDLCNCKKMPIVFKRSEHKRLEVAFVKNPNSGNWEEVWLDLKKINKITHQGYDFATLW